MKELDLWQLLKKRARLVGSTLRARSDAFKAALIRKFAEDFKIELRRGGLKPVIDKVGRVAQKGIAPSCLGPYAHVSQWCAGLQR